MSRELPDELKPVLQRVTECYGQAEKLHAKYRTRWERYYSLWFNYNDSINGSGVDRRDRDQVFNWARREWGAELFIPLIYSTMETVLPRAISQLPRMLVTPRPLGTPAAPLTFDRLEDNAEHHRILLDAQQDRIHYELVLEDIARDGFTFGIGWQKTGWQTTNRSMPKVVPHIYYGDKVPCLEYRTEAVDDPTAEWISPFDVFWDPQAHSVDNCNWIIHRTWQTTGYVAEMLKSGRWNLIPDLALEDIGTGGKGAKYDALQSKRMQAEGLSGALNLGEIHEVWEFHDGAEVITVLDGQWPVQKGPNPLWHGELPFQAFRPTRVTGRMVGRGVVEPLEDLNAEMNTIRSQRLDANTLALIPPFVYQEGLLDPADLKWAAGALIPMIGDPNEALRQIQVQPPPATSYRETDELKSDVDRTSGVSDVVAGADPSGGVSSTATGAQLITSAAGKRIEHMTRRLNVEVVAGAARQWLQMNQIKTLSLPPIKKPSLPTPNEPDRRYEWVKLTLLDTAGEFMVSPEGGNPASDNVPQKRADAAQIRNSLVGDPMYDQRMVHLLELRKLDVANPEAYIAPPPEPPPDEVPPEALDMIQQALVSRGIPADQVGALLGEAVRAAKADQQRQQAQGQNGQPQLPAGPPMAPSGTPTQ